MRDFNLRDSPDTAISTTRPPIAIASNRNVNGGRAIPRNGPLVLSRRGGHASVAGTRYSSYVAAGGRHFLLASAVRADTHTADVAILLEVERARGSVIQRVNA